MTISAVEQFLRRLICPSTAGFRTALFLTFTAVQFLTAQATQSAESPVPPRVLAARRFLQHRGWPAPIHRRPLPLRPEILLKPQTSSPSTAVWQPLGPTAVLTPNYGLVTGRVSSIAIDPSDPTGNHIYIGTTGGGVWVSQNAASSSNVVFTPLTDAPASFSNYRLASISIGALSVQPGGTGVILAGTGDPNDALDSYYGAGILRSTDSGVTWTVIPYTADQIYSFMGEGFAGFAWSTVNPQLVVAAVSQSYEGTLVNAASENKSCAGLYYSTDAGASWSLARITDGPGKDIQGPLASFAAPNGNSVTAVVWNPARQLFIAAVRFHGYYQSSDGVTWTRMTAQPGSGITSQVCPHNPGAIGSIACPVFRGALAVNPSTGDTFAWTVDLFNQDQGLWQDRCALTGGACSNASVTFTQQWSTAPLRTNSALGPATIANGDYNLVLAAVPSAQDTLLFAGDNDLWRCSLAMGCAWRNTTNSDTCNSAKVAPYQHALAWNPAESSEVLIGNDSGLWRSMDQVGEAGEICSADDASHFQNLNASLGPLAEVEDISQISSSPYSMMASLGVNGTAGVKETTGPTKVWPQILGGEGGPVAAGAANPVDWYVNNGAGVSIYRCLQSENCSSGDFGVSPVVDNTDVAGDGYTMTSPAPFMVDPLDSAQLLVGTCRLWRGPTDGTRWTSANAISPILDGISGHTYCSGDALIRSIAAMPVTGGGEMIYLGMFGSSNGGAILGGHLLKALITPDSTSPPSWIDLTLNPVGNDQLPFNYYGLDISSIYIDPHDASGNTLYVTIAGVADSLNSIRTAYRSTDGGAHWLHIDSNLPSVPANSIVIDPQDANTAYIATDEGVFFTRLVSSCSESPNSCWTAFGAGLPYAPVTKLSATPPSVSPNVLIAATYGRGIWQVPLLTAGAQLTTASVDPVSIDFSSQAIGSTSTSQSLTIRNTGGIALVVASITTPAPFSETDDCTAAPVNAGSKCTILVRFSPDKGGDLSAQLTINANIPGGQIFVPLTGTGSAAGLVTASPGSLDFGLVSIGNLSAPLAVTLQNAGSAPTALTSVTATAPFQIRANACGTTLAGNSACSVSLVFAPTTSGPADGSLIIVGDAGTQVVSLKGNGAAEATDSLSATSVAFPPTIEGQLSSPQIVTLSNDGDLPLNTISTSATAGFQVSNTCGGSLVAHASCAISVFFAPVGPGPVSGSVTVADALRSQVVAVSGTGLKAPAIGVSPSQISFPGTSLGHSSNPATVTIANTGGAPLDNVGFQLTGSAASSFSWTASTCGTKLMNGSSCTVQLFFTPATVGQLIAKLSVSSSTAGVSAAQVQLSGIGQGTSVISITPLQLSFTQFKLGEPTAPQIVTISNNGDVPATGLKIATSSAFTITQNLCGTTLAPSASCSTGVVFTPSTNGVVTGSLSVSSLEFPEPASAFLIGTGGAAGTVNLLPGSVTFPTTGVGTTSPSQVVKLTNNGPVQISELKFSVTAGFAIKATTCDASLDSAASCIVEVSFAPANAGQQTGYLNVASVSLPAPAQVPLSGMGFDFAIAITGEISKTVSSGQTAGYMLTLTPSSGSSGTFTFSCSSLPANSSCSFNPASESVPANATGSLTVNISTGNTVASAVLAPSRSPLYFRWLPITCSFFLPLIARRRRRSVLLAAILSAGLICATSCAGAGGGSGGTATPPSGSTPPGSYSIVVTATSNGVSHSATLKLIVD